MITVVTYEDWTQIYSDGALLVEGHSISARQWLDVVRADVEDLDMSTVPNKNFEVDNLAFNKNLAALRAAKEACDGADD